MKCWEKWKYILKYQYLKIVHTCSTGVCKRAQLPPNSLMLYFHIVVLKRKAWLGLAAQSVRAGATVIVSTSVMENRLLHYVLPDAQHVLKHNM